jgi:hypothetical protein
MSYYHRIGNKTLIIQMVSAKSIPLPSLGLDGKTVRTPLVQASRHTRYLRKTGVEQNIPSLPAAVAGAANHNDLAVARDFVQA